MQMAHVFALFLSVASVQFLPGDAAPQAQDAQYQDFCAVGASEKMKFLECLKKAIPTLQELLNESGQTPQSLLASICNDNEGENLDDLTDDMANELPAIEQCLAEIS
uniref:Putative secreted protein n=1 Tax=Amblyomma americanum TaxID=6943 RepID=A0A0C9SCZ3_AMBAM